MARPYPNIEKIQQVMNFRRNKPPIPFAQIAKQMNKDVKTIYRWYQYGSGKKPMRIGYLSTDEVIDELS